MRAAGRISSPLRKGGAEGTKVPWGQAFGAPSMTRTCDLQVRNLTLYPTELWARSTRGPADRGRQSSELAERVGFEPTVP